MAGPVQTKINSARDGSGTPIGGTLDPTGRTEAYKCYTGSLTDSGAPTVLDLYGDLGCCGSKIEIVNVTATSTVIFNIEYSIDGTTYGDPIPAYPSFIWSFENWLPVRKVRLTKVSSNSDYIVLAV